MKKFFLFLLIASFSLMAYAFGADPSPLPSGAPAVAIAVNSWAGIVHAFSISGAAVAIGGVIEVILRRIPSDKPLGLALAASAFFQALGQFFAALHEAVETLVPQKLAPPK